jgi:tetratricopeptide (TPR) repeat protein
MARRLAAVPELFAVAAEQYLPVVDAVVDQAERPVVVGLLRRAAGQASLTGDYSLAEALLAAAIRLIDPGETALLAEVHTGHHAALYGLGRLEEADEEYRTIERLCPRALDRADATAVQARSLTHRTRFADAIALGVGSLRELGAAVPPADRLRGEVDRQLQDVYRWLDHAETTAELRRAEISDPALLAEGRLLSAMVPAAYFSGDVITFAWLTLEALRIWIDDGPGRTLAAPRPTWQRPWQRCAVTTPARIRPHGAFWRWPGRTAMSPPPRKRAWRSASTPAGASRLRPMCARAGVRGRG